jgi:hypothetical protein
MLVLSIKSHIVSRNEANTAYRPSVAVAYTSDSYLRGAYGVSHRGIWKPNRSGSGCLASEGYKNVYISLLR